MKKLRPDTADTRRAASNGAAGAPRVPHDPKEPADESVAESIGRAITAPIREAAEEEDKRQTGKR